VWRWYAATQSSVGVPEPAQHPQRDARDPELCRMGASDSGDSVNDWGTREQPGKEVFIDPIVERDWTTVQEPIGSIRTLPRAWSTVTSAPFCNCCS
jgi:hypothetical protein